MAVKIVIAPIASVKKIIPPVVIKFLQLFLLFKDKVKTVL